MVVAARCSGTGTAQTAPNAGYRRDPPAAAERKWSLLIRQKSTVRLLLVGVVVSAAFTTAPAPATPEIYCDRYDPVCLAVAVACEGLETARQKVNPSIPECNLA